MKTIVKSLLASLALATSLHASVFFDVNFDGETVGSTPSTGTLEAYINGDLIGSQVLDPKEPAGFNALQLIRTNANSRFAVAIDNIQAYAIPESGSVTLLVLSSATLLGFRRKRLR